MAVNGVKAAFSPHEIAEQQLHKCLGGFSKGGMYTSNFTTCFWQLLQRPLKSSCLTCNTKQTTGRSFGGKEDKGLPTPLGAPDVASATSLPLRSALRMPHSWALFQWSVSELEVKPIHVEGFTHRNTTNTTLC